MLLSHVPIFLQLSTTPIKYELTDEPGSTKVTRLLRNDAVTVSRVMRCGSSETIHKTALKKRINKGYFCINCMCIY